MDHDSFLNLLSPGLNELDVDWCIPSDGDFFAPQLPTLTWLNNTFMADIVNEEEDEHLPPASTTRAGTNFISDAAEYSSVLKLSDVAMALQNFSRPNTGLSGHVQKNVPSKSSSTTSSSSPPEMSAGNRFFGLDTRMLTGRNCVMQQASTSSSCEKNSVGRMQEPVLEFANSKLNECACNNDEDDDGEEDDEFNSDEDPKEEDAKPCFSHVRIIRRPNSNCGQVMVATPASKRMKMCVKQEPVSFSNEMHVKEGLKKMRREGMSQREVHILSERQRRKSMRESFSILQSLVPKLNALKHTDRITVLTEVITYIHSLRGAVEELDRKKAEIMDFLGMSQKARPQGCHRQGKAANVTYVQAGNISSSDDKGEQRSGGLSSLDGELVAMVEVTVRMCASDVFITVNTPRHMGVWSRLMYVLQKYDIEVSNASLASCEDSSFHCIHGKVCNAESIQGIDLQEKLEGGIIKELCRPPKRH